MAVRAGQLDADAAVDVDRISVDGESAWKKPPHAVGAQAGIPEQCWIRGNPFDLVRRKSLPAVRTRHNFPQRQSGC